jgi:hypothetical protein
VRISLAPSTVLAAVDPVFEAPLSVRSLLGIWLLLVILGWFTLAYRTRHAPWWEMSLIVVGAAVALPRVGNTWLAALVLLVPLARQLTNAPRWGHTAIGAVGLGAAIVLTMLLRPPQLPAAVLLAVPAAGGTVYTDWRWATALKTPERSVLASNGLTAESDDFWLDYLRVAQGHERWDPILRAHEVRLVVLDARDRQRPAAELIRETADWRVLLDDGAVLIAQRSAP